MKKYRSQESGVRRGIFISCILTFAFCLLNSAAFSSSWDAKDVLQGFLADKYPWEKIEISNIKIIGAIPDKAPDTITVEKGPVGKAVFSFVFDNSQKVTAMAEVRAYDSIVKSKRPFKKGYVLSSDDLYLSEMDINKMPKSSVKDPETIIGKSLNRSIPANITLTEDMVEKSQVVDKGKQVVLLINAHGFNITAAGETREKGYVGKPVKATNLSSKKEVRGVLINERTVEVEL
ncbi:MAG: flagellar basal body P-ring formation protein FlgA [Nitrospirae bacterium]|nr:flagellar basal body P-ring formation protein FlgA [Nitrospirota bacterium]